MFVCTTTSTNDPGVAYLLIGSDGSFSTYTSAVGQVEVYPPGYTPSTTPTTIPLSGGACCAPLRTCQ